ncbi:16S rRNA (cytosine(1402)-N(4))-methyltransferase RsmH [candidate division GN15 bacterium]|nr:16S rRNA (cytosine(1402)-N(4))-methyltransferase RsmH [candidate division GN15 bacterium]
MSDDRHVPVLAARVVSLLITDTHGAYLDLTAGGGGHLLALSDSLDSDARLYGVDADPAAVTRTTQALAGRPQFRQVITSDFGSLAAVAAQLEDRTFDGILLDLGISSYQLDDASRGVSFRLDGPLDMRFNPQQGRAAHELIHEMDQRELVRILREYGEERQAVKIAKAIVRERQEGMIRTTEQLRQIVLSVARPPHQNKTLARVFQALRIVVNRELEQLDAVLPAAVGLLKPGGRLAVIAYHSLEDRRVKQFIRDRKVQHADPLTPPESLDPSPRLAAITRKPIVPDDNEIAANPRARSARLRVAERLPEAAA